MALKKLTQAQVEEYERDSFVRCVDVLTPSEVAQYRKGLEDYEAKTGRTFGFPEKSKSHLLFEWADSIVNHPQVLDAVEDLIGPNILAYHATLHGKEPGTNAFVLWHQDDWYFKLAPEEHVTAWVALSEASELAGCMRMIPGSQQNGLIPHTEGPTDGNIIRLALGIQGRWSESDGVLVPLKAGQASLHNTLTVHASGPNRNTDRRIGLGISYIPTHVKPRTEPRSTALLVRGVDTYRNFHVESRLDRKSDWTQRQLAHKTAYDLYLKAARIPEGA